MIPDCCLSTIDYCKHRNVQVDVSRELIDGIVYTLPEISSNFPEGCHKIDVARVTIPEQVQPGTYKLRLTAVFNVNAFQQQTQVVETEEFEVINNDDTHIN